MEIEQAEELDLVPLNFVDAERRHGRPVHVLLASNALYGRMVADRREHGPGSTTGRSACRVPRISR